MQLVSYSGTHLLLTRGLIVCLLAFFIVTLHSRSLTKTVIDRLRYDPDGASQQILWDGNMPGFGVRVYPSGRKTFVVGYRVKGRWRLMALAPYGVKTLVQARQQARRELGRAADEKDPLEHRQQERAAKTMRELAVIYLDDCRYRARPKKTWPTDQRRLERSILPKIGTRKIESIDLADVQGIHSTISRRAPYEANRTVDLLRRIFNFARARKLFPANLPNPAQGVTRNRETPRKEYVPPEKLPALAEAIDAEQNPYVRAAFWLLLLTGMRRSELLNCQWIHVDLENRRLFLPETKSGEPRYVPLNAAAVEIIEGLPPMLGNPHLLPGQVRDKPLVNIDKPWRRIKERADLPRLRIHDLRRTAGSYMVQAGHSIHAVKNILGHASTRTTEIYARLAEQQSRETSDSYGEALMQTIRGGRG